LTLNKVKNNNLFFEKELQIEGKKSETLKLNEVKLTANIKELIYNKEKLLLKILELIKGQDEKEKRIASL
jgi:hypothetical protein